MPRPMRGGPGLLLALALAVGAAARADADSLHDPALRFSQTRTAHFVIYFHQGEESLAARLAAIAEDAWRRLAQRLGPTPPPLTHVVLVDETELANGSAYPLPRDTIVITAQWPAGSDYIGNTDDWLRLVFTHEFTHIVHLDRSESWARLVRSVFGRVALAYPNLFLPTWQIEGLATYEESVITGEGRLHAGDFQQIVEADGRARTPEPLDRVNGGLTDWPGGLAAYAYGLGFHEYLAERFGADTFRELADRTAARIPYTGSRVFKEIYGESLGDLWREYESSLEQASTPPAPSGSMPRRLTHQGFYVAGPRFAGDSILYSIQTPHRLPSLNRIPIAGGKSERLATRFLGSTVGVGASTLYFDQQELRRNQGLYSDLYALDRSSGRVRRLTDEARLIDPDLSPDGTTLVAVQDRRGRRDLVTIPLKPDGTLGAVATLVSRPELQFNAPRWSPDGRSIAVERHALGSLSDVVVVDAATGRVAAALTRPGTRVVTPSWTRDGQRVVAAVAKENAPFQIFEIALSSGDWRPITNVPGGALWPEISPDGRTLVYVGYTVDGFDLFTMPYGARLDLENAAPVLAAQPRQFDTPPVSNLESHPYSPWPTLLPTSWMPIVSGDRHSIRAGVAAAGYDVLGYHAWTASATWLATSPAGAPLPPAAEPDWQAAYAYARWRPTFYVSASSDTSFFAGPGTAQGTTSEATLQERQVEAGVLVPFTHIRVAHTALFSLVRATDDFTLANGSLSLTRAAARAGWATSTAHLFGYSISPERGITGGVTVERVDPALGAAATADAITGDMRVYAPGIRQHDVLAIRVAAGASSGDPILRRTFHLGGAGPNTNVLDFGYEAISLLRGFPIDTFAGRDVALVNADYRFPLARIERGVGTWPIFVHTLHGAVFVDAGQAWNTTFRVSQAKTSVGGELSANVVAGYGLLFTTTAGLAYGHDGSGSVSNGTTLYVRVGYAF